MKELPTEFKKYTCKNDVLSGEDDENFYVYDGNQFVRTECKYGHHNDYFSPDVFIAAKMDKEKAYCYSHEDNELRELEIVHVIARMDNAKLYDELIQDDDVLINGEEEYGADCSAEFIGKFSCYLMWFKEI